MSDNTLTVGTSSIGAESPWFANGAGAGSTLALDRARSASAANLGAQQGVGAQLVSGPGQWTANAQATGGTPSASKAAGAAGVQHVCTGVSISIAAGATAQTPVIVNLRDGATGAGTVLATWALSAPVDGTASISLSGLNIIGSAATAMTLEFASANAANVIGSVNLMGYDAI